MIVLVPKFASLLTLVVSSFVLVEVNALPHFQHRGGLVRPVLGNHLPLPAVIRRDSSPTDVEARDYHHHHKGHYRHGGDEYDSGRTKVYANNPLIIFGDGNHVHAHLDKRHHRYHGDGYHGTNVHADDPVIVSGNGNHIHAHSHKRHSHHEHHGTQVHADDPLIVSGDNNHIDSHSHRRANSSLGQQLVSLGTKKNRHRRHQGKPLELTGDMHNLAERGLLDSLFPLAGSIPGVAGVVGLVNMVSHGMLSDTLANLIMSPTPATMGVQSVDGEEMPSYTINASNSSSTTMYLVAQNATANVGPSEQIVLITIPMLNSTDQSVKMYCASYDPNSEAASQLLSHPCSYNPYAGLDTNSTSTRFPHLFTWNIDSGEISPLWQRSPKAESMTDVTSMPDRTGSAGGYVIGGPSLGPYSAQQSGFSGKLAMIFKLDSLSTNNATAAPAASSVEPNSIMAWSNDCDEQVDESQAGDGGQDESQTNADSDNYEDYSSTAPDDSTDADISPEEVQAYGGDIPSLVGAGGPKATSNVAAQQATVVTSTFTMLISLSDVSSTEGIFPTAVSP